ncbi:MAG: hypothetical protein FWE06_01640 [Oscillospiraceae bacterium]|nr:hypothetical protein [Oscillospiraceae bacterium]
MRKLPKMLPEYTITPTAKPPFECKWEEMMGWFLIPRLGEKLSWAMYDWPERERTETYTLEVTGRARVHGVDGVEIVVHEQRGGEHEGHGESRDIIRTFVTQLTDTHCRILAARHLDGEVKQYFTFLDGDAFLGNWGFGEDNCGNEINLKAKGTIRRNGNQITTEKQGDLLDVAGRYTVTIGGKTYDCICVLDVNTYVMGGLAEYFIDANGRTVLWRRFNRNDWKLEYYGQLWSKKLPDNEQLTVNGEIYVHWYDCITDYIL